MELVSERIKRIAESQTLEMAQLSRELKAKGHDVIDLSVGEPDFNTPDHIKEAAKRAIDENFTHYTPVGGYNELINAICQKFEKENNFKVKPNQVVVSNGAKHSLANVILCLVDRGDEILIPSPYWVSYREIDNLAHGRNVFIPTSFNNKFKVTADQIRKAITPKTRVLLYSSPSNPTGSVFSHDELKAIAEVIAEHPNIYIISDEIYEHVNFSGKHESISQFDFIKDQLIVINGVSKAYAMTGWRIGYMAGPEWLAKLTRKLQGQYTSNPCSIAQKAAYAALTMGNESILEMQQEFKERKELVVKLLKDIPGVKYFEPDGTFYVFPDFSAYYGKSNGIGEIKNSVEMSYYLLEKAHVATVAGSAFGVDECLRLSFVASKPNLIEAIDRIKNALANLH